jgi:hypothetical protein
MLNAFMLKQFEFFSSGVGVECFSLFEIFDPNLSTFGNIRLKVRSDNCEPCFDDIFHGKAIFKNVKGNGVGKFKGGKR